MSGADFHAGRKVGKYEVLTLLSMGGMAELFLAFTAGPGGFRKFVALKQILPDIKKDESFVKMFLDEARITAAFSHSNIGQVFDLGEEEGELYLAMEFISGQNLEYLAKVTKKAQTPIPVGFSAMAVRDTCLGLHYAHHFVEPSGKPAPVIHRDVSPKNVMVTYDGNVKVIDFGIAKAKGRLNRTQAGMVKGTTGYMSPEQVRNEQLDGRSDLFSAAAMLWELLCGHRLFDGPSDAATMIEIVEKPIPDPRTINPEVPEALSAVIQKALSRDRAERYATGKEFARAIDAAMGPEIFDEDRAAAFMQQTFAEKVKKTRALLEMASRSDGEISRAAEGLRDEADAASPSPRPRRPSTPGAREGVSRTPGAAPKSMRDSQRLPTRTPSSRTPGARMPAAPPRRRPEPEPEEPTLSPKDRFASSVAQSYALYDTADQETALKKDRPNPGGVTDPRHPTPTGIRPVIRRDAGPANRRWYSVRGAWLVLLLLAGGLTFATTRLDGPLGDFVRPHVDAVDHWVRTEFAGEPPPPPPSAIIPRTPSGPPPELAARFAGPDGQPLPPADRGAAADPSAQATPPEPAPEPEPTPEPAAPAHKSPRKTAAVKPAAAVAKPEKQPAPKQEPKPANEPAPATAAKMPPAEAPATTVTDEPIEVEVLDTRNARAAAEDGVGWLTLYTVPPAYVYDGATRLGTTPLIKVPLPKGVYRLRVMDAESKYRLLSVPIKPGEEQKLRISVSDLPLAPNQD